MKTLEGHHEELEEATRSRILSYSARTLDRITFPHRMAGEGGRKGRKTGRASNRIKKFVPIRCGPQEFDELDWMEADTVSHGGGSSSGSFIWRLTLTDLHSRGEVRVGLERIEKRMPFAMLGFEHVTPPQNPKKQQTAGFHGSWLNDITPPVSFFIGSIRLDNLSTASLPQILRPDSSSLPLPISTLCYCKTRLLD